MEPYDQAIEILKRLKERMKEELGTAVQEADLFVVDKCIAALEEENTLEDKAFAEYCDKEEERFNQERWELFNGFHPMDKCEGCGEIIAYCSCKEAYKRAKMHWC